MKKTILFVFSYLLYSPIFAQINFENKVDIYDYNFLTINVLHDDFDHDGDLDLIKDIPYVNKGTYLQKNDVGDFNLTVPTLIASNKTPIISLDLNNDLYPDLITYNSFDTIGVLYNLQNNTFAQEVSVSSFAGSSNIDPIKIDYNHDGFFDLIVKNSNDDLYVLINNHASGFEPAQFLLASNSYKTYEIADFDNDNDYDFYIDHGSSLKIYLNNNGTFVQNNVLQISSIFNSFGILDFDNNGYKDILYWSNGALWVKYFGYNQANNQFIVINNQAVVPNIPFYDTVGVGSLMYIEKLANNTFALYTALKTTANQYNIYKTNISNGLFTNTQIVLSDFQVNTFNLSQFNILDLNNDHNLDFTFTSDFNNQKMIFINHDINNVNNQTICIQQNINPKDFSAIDMNGDGIEDIAFGTQNGLGFIEKTTNAEPKDIQNLIGVVSNPNASGYTLNNIVDFNNDGLGDIVDFVNFGAAIKVYKNLAHDRFEYTQSISIPNRSIKIYFMDVDSDGFLDILIESLDTSINFSTFEWSKNNNGTSFSQTQPLVLTSQSIAPIAFAFEDFNHDQQTDILLLNKYTSSIIQAVLLINNNGIFTSNTVAIMSGLNSREHLKVKDFDQDGNLDFFMYNNRDDFPFLYYHNNGQNDFSSTLITNLKIEDIDFDDNNGDGIYELYAWNYNTSSSLNNIFYYTTTNYTAFARNEIDSYTAYYDDSEPYTRGSLLLFDYNYDNRKDLFINNYSTFRGLISVYKNTSDLLEVVEVGHNSTTNQLRVYPNPFVTAISWTGEDAKSYQITLYSIEGKPIIEQTITNHNLDFSSLSSGIYLLLIKDPKNGLTQKFKIIKK